MIRPDPRAALLVGALAAASAATVPSSAASEELFGIDVAGSFGEKGFDRYVPAVTQFVLNETPFITTEVKPIFVYHSIPSGFITDGGGLYAGAVQARVAFGDRLSFIATTDGYASIDFDRTLPDTEGLLDLTAGLKYAVISNPSEGNIVSVGARYVAPIGTVDTAGIELNGTGNGYIDVFLTGAKLYESGTQAQASIGVQQALSDENWSFIHAHMHLDHEVIPNLFPLVEANMILPYDGGDRIEGASLTGADVFDIGASDPDPILTLAVGARYRLFDNAIFGAAVEGNVLDIGGETANSVYGWRVTTDITIHF